MSAETRAELMWLRSRLRVLAKSRDMLPGNSERVRAHEKAIALVRFQILELL